MRSKLIAVALSAVAAVAATAAPAHAEPYPVISSCGTSTDAFCLYYNSNNGGSRVGLKINCRNYDYCVNNPHVDPRVKFTTSGSGSGQAVKNNTASVYNYYYGVMRVYANSEYAGYFDNWPAYGYAGSQLWYGNLNSTYNNNASQKTLSGA
ncbi:peptidase M23 [Streptomyces sp. NBC_00690]|uniref:peptidase M23 n=1 Tax=Streptomyces sp. NBC_00690 TaxID=2975808 RepID=UPI002E2A60C9|nr:peptidase M23 [Streptomyces sp. NBC_00690]